MSNKLESNKKYYRTIKGICCRSFNHCKTRVKKYNLDLDLDLDYLYSIYPKDSKCPILGYTMKPSQGKLGGNKYSPSLDRIDPRKGYVKGNVEWVCFLANKMMSDASGEDLVKFSKWINVRYNNII